MAPTFSEKTPPAFDAQCDDFAKWKKKFKLWQGVTDVEKKKQGGLVVLRLDDGTQDAILELMTSEEIKEDGGIDALLTHLDTMFQKDPSFTAYEAYEDFEKYRRPPGLPMAQYLSEFQKRLSKVKANKTTMSEDILAYRLLKSANLTAAEEQLVKVTVEKMEYETMVKQLKKAFSSGNAQASGMSEQTVKVEEEEEDMERDTLYGSGYRGRRYSYNKFQQQPSGYGGNNRQQSPGRKSILKKKRGKNPLDRYGNVTKCRICDSINHWEEYCPDKNTSEQGTFHEEYENQSDYESDGGSLLYEVETHSVSLRQEGYVDPTKLVLTCETFNVAVLDCGAPKTVCGDMWLSQYLHTLSPKDRKKVKETTSKNVYRFGCGSKRPALKRVTVPAVIGETNVLLQTDVVKGDLPLLMGKSCMKQAKCDLNFNDDTINILGQTLNLATTESGHYALPLGRNRQLISDAEVDPEIKLTLHVKNMSVDKVALKLHRQFAHPPAGRLIQLVKNQNKECDELVSAIHKVTKECKVCAEYKKPSPRPVVGLPVATRFGQCVAMDLKEFDSVYLLHMIDVATRLSAGKVIRSKKPAVIIKGIFERWISIFGTPENILSDNGGEFNNTELRELGEKCNLNIKTTAAESPWSNGLVERHNGLMGDMIRKVRADTGCSLELAVMWCFAAHNSLASVHGFSPFQLVFGRNPTIPILQDSKPPALDNETVGEVLRQQLESMHACRQAHTRSESDERLKRALRHNVRPSGDTQYVTGDKVYYKRKSSKKWKGPATVLGRDGQQVLIKHGGILVRVHPCRLSLEKKTVVGFKEESELKPTIKKTSPQYVDESDDEAISGDALNEDVARPLTRSNSRESLASLSGDELLAPLLGDHTEDEVAAQLPDQEKNADDHTEDELAAQLPDREKEDADEPSSSDDSVEESDTSENSEDESSVDSADKKKTRGRPPGKVKKIVAGENNTVIKDGMIVKFKVNNEAQWSTVTVVSRAGKAGKRKTGKHKGAWNVKDSSGVVRVINFDKDVSEYEIEEKKIEEKETHTMFISAFEEDVQTEVYLTDTFVSQNKTEVAAAKGRELKSWEENGVYAEVEDKGQSCVSAKWVVKPKVIDGRMSVKARYVLRGYEEDQDFRTDSPTCRRESVRLVLSVLSTKEWKINSIDFKTAFLQGKAINRDIYVKPPKEAQTDKIWKLKKTVYGLRDAPRQWYLKLKGLILELGCKLSSVDNGLFMLHVKGELIGLIVSFVDDILWGGTTWFKTEIIQKIKTELNVGSEQSDAFSYIGIQMSQEKSSITVSQKNYIAGIQPVEISKEKGKKSTDQLTKEERKKLRSVVGKLNWVNGISRPDIGFALGMVNISKKATVNDIKEANKVVNHVKNTPTDIVFPKFKGLNEMYLKVYTDASHANLSDSGSQGGHIVFLTDGTNACPLAWHSNKIQRIVKSTIAAETLSLVDGCETAFFISKLVAEVVSGDITQSVPVVCVTDNRSLFETAHSTSTLVDRRLQLEMGIIRQMVSREEIKLEWCSTESQASDVLTKKGASGVKLREILQNGRF